MMTAVDGRGSWRRGGMLVLALVLWNGCSASSSSTPDAAADASPGEVAVETRGEDSWSPKDGDARETDADAETHADADAHPGACVPGDACPGGLCMAFPSLDEPSCTRLCGGDADCEPGWYCTGTYIEEFYLCAPRAEWACRRCDDASVCRGPDARCVTMGADGYASCTWTCADAAECPAGYGCREVEGEAVCAPDAGGCCEGLLCPGVVTCEPATGCAIVTDGVAFKAAVLPFDGPADVHGFYGYGALLPRAAGLDPDLVRGDVGTFVWYREPGGNRYLVVVFDRPSDPTGGDVLVALDHTPGWDLAFVDDPDDSVELSPRSGDRWVSLHWPAGETDGFILGPVPPGAACLRLHSWTLNHVRRFDFLSGPDHQTFPTDQGYQLPLLVCPQG